MQTDIQVVFLQGVSFGFLYWDSFNDETYTNEEYPTDYEERYQIMLVFFAIIITRWYEQL